MAEKVLRRGDAVFDVGKLRQAGGKVLLAQGAELVLEHSGRIIRGAVERDGDRLVVHYRGMVYRFEIGSGAARPKASASAASEIVAPMTGRVVQVFAKQGDAVVSGAPLLILEAMKMEHKITAPQAAIVTRILVAAGDQVEAGALLASLRFQAAP